MFVFGVHTTFTQRVDPDTTSIWTILHSLISRRLALNLYEKSFKFFL